MKRYSLIILFAIISINLIAHKKQAYYGDRKDAGHYIKLRGIKFYYEVYGSGKPLLLIHGNGRSISTFGFNIPYFAAHKYKVIAVDSRAHGKSTDPGDSLSFEMMADDFAALLDSMRIDSAYVIGWSDGGITALLMAMRHPSKVKKLIASGANLWPDTTAIKLWSWQNDFNYYAENKNKTFTDPEEKNRWKIFLLDWFQPNIALRDLEAVKCPSMIVAGDYDLIKLEHTIQIFQHIPQAYLWILPNSGHATLVEHAKDFNPAAAAFFSEPFLKR